MWTKQAKIFEGGLVFNRKISLDSVKKQLWDDLQKSCSNNIIAFISYGNGTDSSYLSLATKHNFLIVTNSLTAEDLARFAPLQKQWAKKYQEFPLFLTVDDLKTSADVFPIEFLNMRDSYTVIGGQDVLKDLDIPLVYLRTQCELSIKGKIIILRQGYVENIANAKSLIANSFPAFFKVFINVLRLLNKQIPDNHDETIKAICQLANTDNKVFLTLNQLPVNKKKFSQKEIDNLFAEYLDGLQTIANFVDRLEVKG